MKIGVVGSRNFDDYKKLEKELNKIEGITVIVSGGAKGADTLAREFAEKNDIKLTEFKPDYEQYGRGAPIRRNKKIVEYSDQIIAFWDGESRGTKNTIDIAEKQDKPIIIIRF
tara:strand:- start:132 stop:470 length:339 start_codon:yes stop_codon:yes gene_type:complete